MLPGHHASSFILIHEQDPRTPIGKIIDLSHTIYSANARHSLFSSCLPTPHACLVQRPRRIGKENPTFVYGKTWLYRKGRVECVPERCCAMHARRIMCRRKRSDVECEQVLVQGSRKAYGGLNSGGD